MHSIISARRIAVFGACTLLFLGASSPTRGSAQQAPSVVAAPNIVANTAGAAAYYRLNDSDATMRDSSGHKANGRYGMQISRGGPVLTAYGDRTPVFLGGAYNTSRFASAPLNPNLQPTGAVTVEAWIRQTADNTNGFLPIVSYGKHSQGSSYVLMISPQNVLDFYVHTSSGGFYLQGFTNIAAGSIYHVAATYDGHTAALYVNGVFEKSVAKSGSIEYQNLNRYDGLGIGGALDKGAPQFNGSISNVAIYRYALTANAVQSHFVEGTLPLVLNEHAASSNAFVDTIGVNTHFHYQNTTYDTQFERLKALLLGLGVHHIRDGMIPTAFQAYFDRLNELGRVGIHSDLTSAFSENSSFILGFANRVATSIESIEPPNEPDVHPVGNWVANTRAFQKMLYTTIKTNRSTAKLSVLGPTPENLQDFKAVGDLSQFMDTGNFHLYQPGYNPGTAGFGSRSEYGINGSIAWYFNVARIIDGAHAPTVSETGYDYAPGRIGDVPPDIGAKYLPRLLLEFFNHGIARSYIYQLVDWEGVPSFGEGLIAQNLAPKPPYYALKSLIALLNDPSPPSRTNVVSYALTGNTANVHHTLMQRGDGSYDLALWIETRSMVPTISSDVWTRIAVPAQRVTVRMPFAIQALTAKNIDDRGAVETVPTSIAGSSLTLNLQDSVTIVHFKM